MATLLPLFRAASEADQPRHPEPAEAWLRYIVGPRVGRHRTCVVGFDGGTPVGFGCMNHEVATNQDMLYGDIWIHPERHADATVALLAGFKAYALGRGCTRLVTGFSEFAGFESVFLAEGGRKVSEERRSQLEAATVDRARFTAWAAPSEKNAHYRIEAYVGRTPEHLLLPLVTANEAMHDAPLGDLEFEFPAPDPERRRAGDALNEAAGVRNHVIAAVAEDGAVAGFHEMFVVPGFRMADVGNTGVPAKFRGHGLGLRLKADLMLRVLAAEPEVEVVSTWNASDNRPMLRVNETLGYVKCEAWSNWQFDL